MSLWDGFDEFVAVATLRNFGKAAAALGLSPSHVSRAIARMENRLHVQLFFRTTRIVTLTDTGTALFEQCRRIVEERDEAFAMINEGGDPQGELRLTCSTTLGERFVAPIVRKFAQDFPKLSVTIDLTNRLVDLVSEGCDIAIRTGYLADSLLIGTRIASRRLYCCASPAYLARHRAPDTIADLTSHQCLIGSASTWHFQVREQRQDFRPVGRWRCNSGEAVVDAALADMGICQLPEFYVLPHLLAGRLELALDRFRAPDEPIWAVYPQRRHLLPKVSSLINRLRTELGAALAGSDPAQTFR